MSRIIVKSGLIAALLSVAALASAENVSGPGSSCFAAAGSPSAGAKYWSGEFVNQSTTGTLYVNCPQVVRNGGAYVYRARVVFLDRNISENASCRFSNQWIDASGVTWFVESAPMSSTGWSSGPQTTPWTTVNIGTFGDNQQLQCSVPVNTASGMSSIFRYEVER